MPEVQYSKVIRAPLDQVWEFSKDMGNWAPFLRGYQRHRVISDTESIWTLKGDVGVLSRVVDMQVTVTEWLERQKVAFTIRGITEQVEGAGAVEMFPAEDGGSALPASAGGGKASRLVVTLAISAKGIMGPVVNALLAPMMRPVAEELAQKLAAKIEGLPAERVGR